MWRLPSLFCALVFCDIPFCAQQFRQKYAAASRAAQGIVAQANEFVVVLRIRAQAAQRNGHAALQIAVQAGLGAIRLFKIVQELFGC